MKVKCKKKTYPEVLKQKRRAHKRPKKPCFLLRKLACLLSQSAVKGCNVEYIETGLEKLEKKEPCLILMNHSCFLDMKIAFTYFKKRVFNTVATSDGFVGKEWLMRGVGCIPTEKFVYDISLVKDIVYALKKKRSVLMYPEAGYSFDGKAVELPESLGKLVKYLKVPVVTVITSGAFLRDPLYNSLQLRKVKVKVNVDYFLSSEEIKEKSGEEINAMIKEVFSFDAFKEQQEKKIVVDEPFRAEGLHKILYKCPHCMGENMTSTKLTVKCPDCGAEYYLNEYGALEAENAKFTHIPDWYAWQRAEVRKEIEEGRYGFDIPVDIAMLSDFKAVYFVGEGRLKHDKEGFTLTGEDGLFYKQASTYSHSLNVDYFWYEIGDMISIGDKEYLYYCFPKEGYPVGKARLAVEEAYKIAKGK